MENQDELIRYIIRCKLILPLRNSDTIDIFQSMINKYIFWDNQYDTIGENL